MEETAYCFTVLTHAADMLFGKPNEAKGSTLLLYLSVVEDHPVVAPDNAVATQPNVLGAPSP